MKTKKMKSPYSQLLNSRFFIKTFCTNAAIALTVIFLISVMIFQGLQNQRTQEIFDANETLNKALSLAVGNRITSAKSLMQGIFLTDNGRALLSRLSKEIDPSTWEYHASKNKFEQFFTGYMKYDANISHIFVIDDAHKEVHAYTRNARPSSLVFSNHYASISNRRDSKAIKVQIVPYFYPYLLHEKPVSNPGIISMQMPIYLMDFSEVTGYLVINFDNEFLRNALEPYARTWNGGFQIYTQQGEFLFEYGKHIATPPAEEMDTFLSNGGIAENLLSTRFYTLINGGLILVSELSGNTQNAVIFKILMMAVPIGIGLVLAGLFWQAHKLAIRLNQVYKVMEKVQGGDLVARIPETKMKDLIAEISKAFNQTCDNLEGYINRFYLASLKRKEAELYALRLQVNPHFLFNTLEIIRMHAHTDNSPDTANMVQRFSEIVRAHLKRPRVISVTEEIAFIKSLTDVYGYRFDSRLTIEFILDPELNDCGMLSGLLQPIVENSVIHGFKATQDHPQITIALEAIEKSMRITVRDNGEGISPKDLINIRESLLTSPHILGTGIGIVNVHQQITLLFGNDYGIELRNDLGGGAITEIILPRMNMEDMRKYVPDYAG